MSQKASRAPSVFCVEEAKGHQEQVTVRNNKSLLPLAVMGIVVVVWGLGPPTSKLVSAPPLIGTFIRFGISSPFLLLVLAVRGRWLSKKVFYATALPGLSFGVNLIFVFATLQEATVSVLSTIVAMQPALLLVLAGPIFREYPTLRQLSFTLFGMFGAVGVILGAGSDLRTSWLGLLFAALSLSLIHI